MARYKKNVKRIDPRYFLHETVDRNDDGSALEEKFKGIPAGAATPGKQLKARGSRADRCADLLKDYPHAKEMANDEGRDPRWGGGGPAQAEFWRIRNQMKKLGCEEPAEARPKEPAPVSAPKPKPGGRWTQRSLEEE